MLMYNKTTYEKSYGNQYNNITLPPSNVQGERGPAVQLTEKQEWVIKQNYQDIQDEISVGEIDLEE